MRSDSPTSSLRLFVSWSLPGPSLRLGMRLVRGLSEEHGRAIEGVVARHGPFRTIEGLWRASGVPVRALKVLGEADAFGSMGLDRRRALWEVRGLRDERLELFEGGWAEGTEAQRHRGTEGGERDGATERRRTEVRRSESEIPAPFPDSAHFVPSCLRASVPSPPPSLSDGVHLPPMAPDLAVAHDYASVGLSLRAHPMSFFREELGARGVIAAGDLRDGRRCPHNRRVSVAGVVLMRQRPGTASGIVFMTLEDETGIANLVIRPRVYTRYRRAARHGVCLVAHGHVERQGEVVHVIVHRVEDMREGEAPIRTRSRDFH